jgi:PleD family two-component response regulator
MTADPIRVLIIDQHKEDRAALRRRLLEASDRLRVFEAGSGETALDWFRAVQPDCIVLDWELEDIIVMELLNRITLELSKQPIPIFIWTRLSQAPFSATAPPHGVRGFFEKNKDSDQALVTAILDTTTDR